MDNLPRSLAKVVSEFAKFPGIGRKTAQRLALHLLDASQTAVAELSTALMDLKSNLHECPTCHNIAEREMCEICLDTRRDPNTLCVVEKIVDLMIFERMGDYRGHYHVLGGVISPLDGVTPDDLNIDDLIKRLPEIDELIIATHPSIEGDTTALHIAKLAEPYAVRVTHLARGIPMGANLEFTDEATLASAYNSRVEL